MNKNKTNNFMGAEYKICNCDIESWEDIVVSGDENFEYRTTIYYHCAACSEDYAVIDYDTDEILYLHPKLAPDNSQEENIGENI